MRAIAYLRASTVEQQQSGLGLAAQQAAIEAACVARGWDLGSAEQDIASGAKTDRPGLARALTAIEAGEADCLVVLRLDRLSRSVGHFARLLERYPGKIVCLDVGVDPTTPSGEMVSHVVAAMAQMERKIIGLRTSEALAVKRAQGVRLGRPREMSDEAIERITALRSQGLSVAAIARALNAEGISTPRGGSWFSPGVSRVLSWADAA